MKRSLCLAFAFALVFGAGVSRAAAAPTQDIAPGRCNDQAISQASAQVKSIQNDAGGNMAAVQGRFGELLQILNTLNEERDVLKSLCSSDAQRAPLFTEIAATSAEGLVIAANLAARMNASCPAAAEAIPSLMLADAWLGMANVVNDQGGKVPASFADVVPKIRAMAPTVGLTLPSWKDTSQFWRDQIHTEAKAAVDTCAPPPTPTPAPTPT
jgi:hypothetical protein